MAIEKELKALRADLEKSLAELNRENHQLQGKIARIREQINAIDLLLPGSQPRETVLRNIKTDATKQAESYVPVLVYWPVILQSLVELGGSARSEDVLDKVGAKMDPILTPGDKEMLPSGIDVRWRNRAAWQRFNMVQQNLLKKGSPRGIWEISDQGRLWLEATTRAANK